MSGLDQNPDILKRRPVDISEKVWEEHLAQVKHITNGIKTVLPSNLSLEELNDLVQEAQVYLLEHESDPQKPHPYYTGCRMATKWRRDHFPKKNSKPRKNSKGKVHIKSISDMSRIDGEGKVIGFDPPDSGETVWQSPEDHLYSSLDFNMSRENALQTLEGFKESSPKDYAVVLEYVTRRHARGNRFTRAESVAFESAMRRLKKLGKQDAK